MKKILALTGVFVVLAPAAAALAHGDTHARDHRKHYRFHREVVEDHAGAHEEGFRSRRQHRAYHRGLRQDHHEFHDDHPNTRHEHYRWW